MPLGYDIELDGDGYMVAPGSYKRSADGWPEGRLGRVTVTDFFGGQRQALQQTVDRSWDSVGIGPALFGQGVEPWPYIETFTDPSVGTVSITSKVPQLVAGNNVWIGLGRYLYRSFSLTSAAWASWTQVADMGAGKVIEDLAYYRGDVLITCGSGLEAKRYNIGTGVVTPFGGGGIFAGVAVGYANQLAYSDASAPGETTMKISTGTGPDARELDAPIINMTVHSGRIAIATRNSLYLFSGRADPATSKWIGEPDPIFSAGATDIADFVFLLSYGGKLYTWVAGQVVEWNPNAGNNRQGWRATGVDGIACYGATVAGNMLIVCIMNRQLRPETWAFDGTGWWLIRSSNPGIAPRIWPIAIAGVGNMDLLTFRDGHTGVTYDLHRLTYRGTAEHNYNTAGAFTSSLMDAGERDKTKAWRKIGCTFAAPVIRGNPASTDAVTLTLSYSIDGGQTFTSAAMTSVNDPSDRILTLEAMIASGDAVSRFLQIRVSFADVADWSPTLTGAWAEYELLDSPARRRKWQFKVHARDNTVQRDGSAATNTGQQLASGLWTTWENGATVPFKDIDFDLTTTTHQVRVVGISEEIPKPSDGGRWGESTLSLTLVEV